MPLVMMRNKQQAVRWEPTTNLLCSKCREPLEILPATLGRVNFTFDFVVPDPLEQGQYWYLHKHCAWIEDALDVNWGWHPMGWVLGKDAMMQRHWGSLQKYLKKRMPSGAYDRLYEQWLPAIKPVKGVRTLSQEAKPKPPMIHTPKASRILPATPAPQVEIVPATSMPRRYKIPVRPRWLAIRFMVLKRDGYRCQMCGIAAKDDPDVRLEVDHVIPRSRGGTDDPMNLWVLCFDCNHGKGTQDL